MEAPSSPYRIPLPNELYRQELEYVGKFTGLDSPDKAFGFLENRLVGLGMDIDLAVRYPSEFPPYAEHLPESARLNVFYETVLFRYLQKASGNSSRNHRLTDFDTPQGNQVDGFLAEIFKIS